ncbi:secreted protein [Melampsora americana]|nr:secreted protein [Melampsora americana]
MQFSVISLLLLTLSVLQFSTASQPAHKSPAQIPAKHAVKSLFKALTKRDSHSHSKPLHKIPAKPRHKKHAIKHAKPSKSPSKHAAKPPGRPLIRPPTPRPAVVPGMGRTVQCTKYNDANTQGTWCNYAYKCSGGCTGSFTIGQQCYLLSEKTDFVGRSLIRGFNNPPVASVVCTVDYSDYAQDFIACNTKTESYACKSRAKSGTFATCHNCVPTHGIAM